MNNITIVMAYYNNGEMLREHLTHWRAYPDKLKPHFKAIIVDDGSQRSPAVDQVKVMPFPIEVYRVIPDIPWNQDGARNLGMTHASGWCLLTDMDHLLEVDQAQELIKTKLRKGNTYIPDRRKYVMHEPHKRHPNSYIIHESVYWQAGGYDERFAGYYGTDRPFYHRVRKVTGFVMSSICLTVYGRHIIPDASTVDYGRQGSEYHVDRHPEIYKLREQAPWPMKPLNFEWERVL